MLPAEPSAPLAARSTAGEPPIVQRDPITAAVHQPSTVVADPVVSRDTRETIAADAPLARIGATAGLRPDAFPLRTVPIVAARTIEPAIDSRPLGSAATAGRTTRVVAARVIAPGVPVGVVPTRAPASRGEPAPGAAGDSVAGPPSAGRVPTSSLRATTSADQPMPIQRAAVDATASEVPVPPTHAAESSGAESPPADTPAPESPPADTPAPESRAAESPTAESPTTAPLVARTTPWVAASVASSPAMTTWSATGRIPASTTTRSATKAPVAATRGPVAALVPVQRAFGLPSSLPSLPSAPDPSSLAPSLPSMPQAPDLSSLASRAPDLPSTDELRSRAADAMPEAADAMRSASDTLTRAGQALSPTSGGAAAGASTDNVEQLVRKLYGPLVRRIKAELLLDRERRGIRIDGI